MPMSSFAAIDFETANHSRDSACAIGVVVVEGDRIVLRKSHLIRPPTPEFYFTHIHGITWHRVARAPTFAEVWRELKDQLDHVDFLAAHNASFDSGVLTACCRTYALGSFARPFVCTMQVARRTWQIHPTRLPDVCRRLQIPLRHHEALSDAEACAQIVIAARKAGWRR